MRKVIFLGIAIFAIGCASVAGTAEEDLSWGVSLGVGGSHENIEIYRVGLLRQWNKRWLESDVGFVDGYFELSYNCWGNGDMNGVAFSPVFKYVFNTPNDVWRPYVELGLGVSYFDETLIEHRDMSSNFLFEDRVGIGVEVRNLDISFRYMHYSNADIEKPNDGIDIFIGSIGWYF